MAVVANIPTACTLRGEENGGVVGFDGASHEYCPYSHTSKDYDATRAPLGLSIHLGSMCLSNIRVHEQHVLDIGCGTGTFMEAIKDKVGSVTGVEYNEGMLAQAVGLLGPNVDLCQGSADSLPFDDKRFDACTINQVIHHFPKADGYAFARRCFEEAFRVLRPGGCLILNTSMPEQQRDGFWWLSLFPNASDAICSRFPPLTTIEAHLRDAGFNVDADSVAVPLRRTLMAESRYLEHGVRAGFSGVYRSGDSSWAMAENLGELKDGLNQIQAMLDDGTADQWLVEREALRHKIGQATFITARKPL
jgi:ubiquinone/menaquinone biosynthesis C-methylase UbiE